MAAARCTVDSPVGPLTIAAEGGAVSAIAFGAGGGARPNGGVLAEAARQLTEYFAGARQDFTLPLAPAGTPFRLRVWAAMQAIPYGRTMSYGALARALGTCAARRRRRLRGQSDSARHPLPPRRRCGRRARRVLRRRRL